ncbi:Microsomal glutathione S-transferase 3 [Chlorella vulgaris]
MKRKAFVPPRLLAAEVGRTVVAAAQPEQRSTAPLPISVFDCVFSKCKPGSKRSGSSTDGSLCITGATAQVLDLQLRVASSGALPPAVAAAFHNAHAAATAAVAAGQPLGPLWQTHEEMPDLMVADCRVCVDDDRGACIQPDEWQLRQDVAAEAKAGKPQHTGKAIAADNIGAKMLASMGWRPGEHPANEAAPVLPLRWGRDGLGSNPQVKQLGLRQRIRIDHMHALHASPQQSLMPLGGAGHFSYYHHRGGRVVAMVRIIDGEIVQDDDPRVTGQAAAPPPARQGPPLAQPPPPSAARRGGFDFSAPPLRVVPDDSGSNIANLPNLVVFGRTIHPQHVLMLIAACVFFGVKGLVFTSTSRTISQHRTEMVGGGNRPGHKTPCSACWDRHRLAGVIPRRPGLLRILGRQEADPASCRNQTECCCTSQTRVDDLMNQNVMPAAANVWMSLKVGQARKKFGVKYPTLYEDATKPNAKAFNCRAHQNSLENLPSFYALLLVAGIRYPVSASIAGAVALVGRIAYFIGYSTGEPSARMRGAFTHLGVIALAGMVARWAMERQDVVSRIQLLQAADLPTALHGLLKEAQSLLKPPSRCTSGAGAPQPASADARLSLVLAILELLERAALLTSQHCDSTIIKASASGSQAQLLAAFQKHSWMWELLLRKHLADLLLRPAAAQIFVEAAAGLPSIVQERLYSLWRQQLLLSQHDSQPLHLSPVLLQQLLEQLRLCFQARSIALPQLPGDVPQTAGASAAAADAARQPLLPQSGGTEVRVVLREHLPSLLHLLLTACCCGGGDGRQPAEVTSSQQHADGSSGRASGNAPHAPSLSSMQSAAAAGVRQSQRPQAGGSSSLRQAQQVASGAGSSPVGACCQVAVGSSAVREGLLRHAVLLVSKLSNPDALHEMLSILPQHHAGCGAGADSDSDRDEGRSQQQQRQLSRRDAAKVQTAVALIEVCLDGMLTLPKLAAAVHQQLHGKASSTGGGVTDSRPAQQDAGANPSSSGAASRPAAASAMAASVAEAAGSQQAVGTAAAAAAEGREEEELRHSVGLMLGMHRELSRLQAEQELQGESCPCCLLLPALLAPARASTRSSSAVVCCCGVAANDAGPGGELQSGSGSRQRQQAQALSPPACQRLLSMLAEVQPQPQQQQTVAPKQQQHVPSPAAVASPNDPADLKLADSQAIGGGGNTRRSTGARGREQAALGVGYQSPPALLLVPPQLAVQGLELVCRAVAADGSGSGSWSKLPPAGSISGASRLADMAVSVSAIYLACYQAMWGGRVLRSAEAYQLLLVAAKLRMLLHSSGGGSTQAGAGTADNEAAAEAALVAQNAVSGRRRRPRSCAADLQPLGAAGAATIAAGGATSRAKRLKADPGGQDGDAVRQLLQLFQQQPLSAPQAGQPGEALAGSGPGSQQGQVQQQHRGGRRVVAVQVQQRPEGSAQPSSASAHKRITPQQLAPSAAAAAAAAGVLLLPAGSQQQQEQPQQAEVPARGNIVAAAHGAMAADGRVQQRVVISKAANMTEEEQDEVWAAYIADKEFLVEMLGDADYQQWYDEGAHPLRRQQHRAGGLEAAWAAVLGGPAAGSLVQQQLPRSLLQASGQMPWDAAAAACLRLLRLLLRSLGSGGADPVAVAAGADASAAPALLCSAQQSSVLLRAFAAPLRRQGALAAANALLGITGSMHISTAVKAAQAAPAGGVLLLLSAHLLALVRGERSAAESSLFGGSLCDGRPERPAPGRQWATGRCRLTAPPLLDAYAALLADLLAAAQRDVAADPTCGLGKPLQRHQLQLRPVELSAALATRLMLLPPPTQHMLAPGCALLLRLAVADADAQQAMAQLAALLWMLAQAQQSEGGVPHSWCGGLTAAVRVPPDCPEWLLGEALMLEGPREVASQGHALLLRPLREVQAAAAAELLTQLRQSVAQRLEQQQQQQQQQQQEEEGSFGVVALSAEVLLPAADACHASVQLLLLEWQAHKPRRQGVSGDGSDAESEEAEEEAEQSEHPLLAGSPAAVAELAGLAAALCLAGAAAGGTLASLVDAAPACGGTLRPQQRGQQLRVQGAKIAGEHAPASTAAGVLALCNQFLEVADRLLQSGCLPPGVAQQQLEAACEQLEGQLQAVEQLCLALPQHHPLLLTLEAAMDAAPQLWRPAPLQPDQSDDKGSQCSSSDDEQQSTQGGCQPGALIEQQQQVPKGRVQRYARKQRGRRLKDVRNPALRAMLAEDGCAGELDAEDLSDLEDFIVCNPERDYDSFFRRHFWQAKGSDSEEEEEQQQEEEEPQQAPRQKAAAGVADKAQAL